MSIQIHTPNLMSLTIARRQRKVWKTKFKQKKNMWCAIRSKAIKSNLICIMSRLIHIQMSSQYHKTGEESPEKFIFAKGNTVVYQISSQYLQG